MVANPRVTSATSRVSRLSTRQRIQQSRYRYHKDRSSDAELDKLLNPDLEMREIHYRVVAEYKAIYDELKSGTPEDQELAGQLNDYVREQTGRMMPEQSREHDRGLER